MPFGAEVLARGGVRFRLWAPESRHVTLCFDSGDGIELEMQARDDGWFEILTDRAQDGSRYRFRIDGGLAVPDPASRYQPQDVHGASQVVDPRTFPWRDIGWRGRPFAEAVFYELHIGTFTPAGTFRAALEHLGYLADLGITALQLMPVAEFSGARNWGYDGALKYAVESAYGTPDDFKELVQAAHALGLMVFLDVVCNHFGPDGNYLHLYAPGFFTEKHVTPWGAAIDFEGAGSFWVRQFFIHNALYWLEEYHLDGLRLDAVHAIYDGGNPSILEELADAVMQVVGRERSVHLVLENDENAASHLLRGRRQRPRHYTAQWNDDLHHALHVVLTGERGGYYGDYADHALQHLGRALCEGFAYQGEPSAYRGGRPRGQTSRHLPPTAFVNFLQNHDQIGNRPFGERIGLLATPEALRAATAILLLAPAPPLLFMGQEWGSTAPFLYFCDFEGELGLSVTEGRRRGFADWPGLEDEAARESIPDPRSPVTRLQCLLDWDARTAAAGRDWLALHRVLLRLRAEEIVPRLAGVEAGGARFRVSGNGSLEVFWRLRGGGRLLLVAHLGPGRLHGVRWPDGRKIYATPGSLPPADADIGLPGWSVVWFVQEPGTP